MLLCGWFLNYLLLHSVAAIPIVPTSHSCTLPPLLLHSTTKEEDEEKF